MNERKAKLEAQITEVAGRPVEITVRGEKAFTFSFEGFDADAVRKIGDFFGGALGPMEVVADAECDATFVYFG